MIMSIAAPFNFVWSILRWILFIFILVMSISTHIYSNSESSQTTSVLNTLCTLNMSLTSVNIYFYLITSLYFSDHSEK